jgi:hypothetical protein
MVAPEKDRRAAGDKVGGKAEKLKTPNLLSNSYAKSHQAAHRTIEASKRCEL